MKPNKLLFEEVVIRRINELLECKEKIYEKDYSESDRKLLLSSIDEALAVNNNTLRIIQGAIKSNTDIILSLRPDNVVYH